MSVKASSANNYPSTIEREKGLVNAVSNYYRGKAVVLNTAYGELVLFSSSDSAISGASDLIMPSSFSLDITMAQDVSIFSSKHVSDNDSNQELIASQAEELEEVYAKLEKEFNSGEDARCKLDDAKDQIEALEVAAKAAIIMISEISGMDISDVALDVNNRAMGLIEATKWQGEEG